METPGWAAQEDASVQCSKDVNEKAMVPGLEEWKERKIRSQKIYTLTD